MIKVKQSIMSGITPRAPTAFKVTKIDCYKPHTVKDEVEICLTCDLPKCLGGPVMQTLSSDDERAQRKE